MRGTASSRTLLLGSSRKETIESLDRLRLQRRQNVRVGVERDPDLSESSARAIDLVPFMAKLRIRRQWTGLCDMSPDYSPLMGQTDTENFLVSSGWGTWGFKAIPASGLSMAELVATGTTPPLITPIRVDRFYSDRAIADRSSAGTH
jgi:sarcosine oxidase subunit beta